MTDLTQPGPIEAMSFAGRELSIWTPRPAAPEVDYHYEREIALGRARQVGVFSPMGVNATRIHRTAVVGSNFKLALRPDALFLGMDATRANEWAREVEREWEAYANSPLFSVDAAGQQTWTHLMSTAYATFLMSGEAIGAVRWKRDTPSRYRTCLQLLEPERISQPMGQPETPRFRQGIEMDQYGAPIAYHIRDHHPVDHVQNVGLPTWRREARHTPWGRARIVHMMDRIRPEMIRGLSQFLSAVKTTRMLDMYDAAELEAAIVQAGFAAVIKTELDHKDAMGVAGAISPADITAGVDGQRSLAYMSSIAPYHAEMAMTVAGAKVVHLLPGETLETVKPNHPGLHYPEFSKLLMQKLAASYGTSYESLSRDFSQTSYAAARMSLGDVWRHYIISRDLLIRTVCLPFFFAWLEEAVDEGMVTLPNGKRGTAEDLPYLMRALAGRSSFISWGMPSIDSMKERGAQKIGLDCRLTSLADEAAAEGRDWEDTLEQQAREREYMRSLGIPLPEEIDAMGKEKGGDDEDDKAAA